MVTWMAGEGQTCVLIFFKECLCQDKKWTMCLLLAGETGRSVPGVRKVSIQRSSDSLVMAVWQSVVRKEI